jgi:hypothetical protein
MSKDKLTSIEIEERSGNVFANLGIADADGLFTRSRLGFHVYKILTDRQLVRAKPRPCWALISGL